MDPEVLFRVCNLVAMSGWGLLILFPRKDWSARIAAGTVIPLLLAVVYVGLLAANWGGHAGGFSSLHGVSEFIP